jgi:hypothetical protein
MVNVVCLLLCCSCFCGLVVGINVEVTGSLFNRWEYTDVIVNSRVATAFDADDHFFVLPSAAPTLSLNITLEAPPGPTETLTNYSFHFPNDATRDGAAEISFTPLAASRPPAGRRWRVVNVTIECADRPEASFEIVHGAFDYVPFASGDTVRISIGFLKACGPANAPRVPRADLFLSWQFFKEPIVAHGVVVDDRWRPTAAMPLEFSPLMRESQFTLSLNASDDWNEGGCSVRIVFESAPGLTVLSDGLSRSTVIVTHRFPITRTVNFACLDTEALSTNMTLTIEHFAPVTLRFAVPCDKAPRFTEKDAEFTAHRFLKDYLSQAQLHGYAQSVAVRQLRDIKDAKLGRDDDWDDYALLTFLNTTPPSLLRAQLPAYWGGLHVFYDVIEECAPDFIECWDNSHALRRGPPCVYDECPPNAHLDMWLWIAFGAGLMCVAMCTLFICVVKDWRRDKREETARRQQRLLQSQQPTNE